MICLQVGASNELPESEELDALYDRFLIRKKVGQVSSYGLSDLLADVNLGRAAFHSGEERTALETDQNAIASTSDGILDISQDMFRTIRQASSFAMRQILENSRIRYSVSEA